MPTPITPDLAELKRLYEAMTRSPSNVTAAGTWYTAAHNAFPALLAAAEDRDRLKTLVEQNARDWSEDHDHLQALCRAAGVPEDEMFWQRSTEFWREQTRWWRCRVWAMLAMFFIAAAVAVYLDLTRPIR